MQKSASLIVPLLLCCLATVVAEETSETSDRLKQALQRFPAADANNDGILTLAEARAFLQKQKQNQRKRPTPTHADVAYGEHARNQLDLWLANSEKPTPLVVYIHGGGFMGGSKSKVSAGLISQMNAAGISVAAINYRLTDGGKNPYPIPMHDGARAIQFLRHNAKKYNLNPDRFAATGGSAGGCMSLWLAFHDDLADAKNSDPVLRQSSRLTAAAPQVGPTSLHKPTLHKWFEVKTLREHPAGRPLFAIPVDQEVEITGELEKLILDASPITHLTADDPPVYQSFGANKKVTETSDPGVWVHHPVMGIKLKEAMDKIGVECHVDFPGGPEHKPYKNAAEFLIKKLIE